MIYLKTVVTLAFLHFENSSGVMEVKAQQLPHCYSNSTFVQQLKIWQVNSCLAVLRILLNIIPALGF
jgi:hypothetical protein